MLKPLQTNFISYLPQTNYPCDYAPSHTHIHSQGQVSQKILFRFGPRPTAIIYMQPSLRQHFFWRTVIVPSLAIIRLSKSCECGIDKAQLSTAPSKLRLDKNLLVQQRKAKDPTTQTWRRNDSTMSGGGDGGF